MATTIGAELRKIRLDTGETLEVTASAVGVDRSHLTKIELNQDKPSPELLNSIIAHFSLPREKASRLWGLAGFYDQLVVVEEGRKENQAMADKKTVLNNPVPSTNVTIDPNKQPILYSESVFIGSSDFGLTMDFAQRVGPSDQQFVVARVGMSFEHAKKMLEVLNDHLQKIEKN